MAADAPRNVAIIGGGAFSLLGVPEARAETDSATILWGVGRSCPVIRSSGFGLKSRIFRMVNEMQAMRTHMVASVRDKEWARNGIQFVPCSSVNHPLVEIEPGNSLGIFVNANLDATGANLDEIARSSGISQEECVFGTNGLCYEDFLSRFKMIDRVITNSYHVCYWSLLSGRKVKLLGYSTKFTSLLNIFNLRKSDLYIYKRGSAEGLQKCLYAALHESSSGWLDLGDCDMWVNDFRGINDDFAHKIVRTGYFSGITRKPDIQLNTQPYN